MGKAAAAAADDGDADEPPLMPQPPSANRGQSSVRRQNVHEAVGGMVAKDEAKEDVAGRRSTLDLRKKLGIADDGNNLVGGGGAAVAHVRDAQRAAKLGRAIGEKTGGKKRRPSWSGMTRGEVGLLLEKQRAAREKTLGEIEQAMHIDRALLEQSPELADLAQRCRETEGAYLWMCREVEVLVHLEQRTLTRTRGRQHELDELRKTYERQVLAAAELGNLGKQAAAEMKGAREQLRRTHDAVDAQRAAYAECRDSKLRVRRQVRARKADDAVRRMQERSSKLEGMGELDAGGEAELLARAAQLASEEVTVRMDKEASSRRVDRYSEAYKKMRHALPDPNLVDSPADLVGAVLTMADRKDEVKEQADAAEARMEAAAAEKKAHERRLSEVVLGGGGGRGDELDEAEKALAPELRAADARLRRARTRERAAQQLLFDSRNGLALLLRLVSPASDAAERLMQGASGGAAGGAGGAGGSGGGGGGGGGGGSGGVGSPSDRLLPAISEADGELLPPALDAVERAVLHMLHLLGKASSAPATNSAPAAGSPSPGGAASPGLSSSGATGPAAQQQPPGGATGGASADGGGSGTRTPDGEAAAATAAVGGAGGAPAGGRRTSAAGLATLAASPLRFQRGVNNLRVRRVQDVDDMIEEEASDDDAGDSDDEAVDGKEAQAAALKSGRESYRLKSEERKAQRKQEREEGRQASVPATKQEAAARVQAIKKQQSIKLSPGRAYLAPQVGLA